MSSKSTSELSDTAYDILKVLGKDADFLYDTMRSISKMQKQQINRIGKDMADNQRRQKKT